MAFLAQNSTRHPDKNFALALSSRAELYVVELRKLCRRVSIVSWGHIGCSGDKTSAALLNSYYCCIAYTEKNLPGQQERGAIDVFQCRRKCNDYHLVVAQALGVSKEIAMRVQEKWLAGLRPGGM